MAGILGWSLLLPLTTVAGGGLGVSESDVSEERTANRGFATFEKSFMYDLSNETKLRMCLSSPTVAGHLLLECLEGSSVLRVNGVTLSTDHFLKELFL